MITLWFPTVDFLVYETQHPIIIIILIILFFLFRGSCRNILYLEQLLVPVSIQSYKQPAGLWSARTITHHTVTY